MSLSNKGQGMLGLLLVLFVGVIIIGFAVSLRSGTGGIDTDAVLQGIQSATTATCNAIEQACK